MANNEAAILKATLTFYSISSACSIVKVQLAINTTTFEPLLQLLKMGVQSLLLNC